GSNNLRLDEVTVAADEIRAYADPGATVIFGAGLDKKLGDTLQITVIATGFDLSDEPVAPSFVASPRLAEEPPTAYAGAADRRAPIDLEAPSYIRRGRRRGDLPLEGPTDRTSSTGLADASAEAAGATEDERQAEPVGERQRRK